MYVCVVDDKSTLSVQHVKYSGIASIAVKDHPNATLRALGPESEYIGTRLVMTM